MSKNRKRNETQKKERGVKETRRTGIEGVGDVPWGTHFCLFYHITDDLIDILVPYFKAGLENNEFCMWVTSEPLSVDDATRALMEAVKEFDTYSKKGQIEILDYSEWYTQSGKFEADTVLQGWVEKERLALKNGFDGLRLTGNTFWLEKSDWKAFTEYEATVDSVIGNYRMIALCSYSLDKCRAAEVIDVVKNHRFALIRRAGTWELIESAERKKAEAEVKHLNLVLKAIRNVNQMIVREKDRDRLIQVVCSALIETIGYHSAWIALFDEAGGLVAQAEAGLGEAFLPLVERLKRGVLPDCGQRVLSEPDVVVTKDPALTCGDCPLADKVNGSGMMTIRLERDGKVYGLWCVTCPVEFVESKDEQLLFKEVAADLAFTLHDMEQGEKRRGAEDALRESEKRFRIASQIASDVVYERDLQTGIATFYGDIDTHLGYDLGEFPRTMEGWREHVHPEDLAWIDRQSIDQLEPGVPHGIEYRMRKKDGTYMTWWDRIILIRDGKTGKPLKFIGAATDITERKKAKEALKKQMVHVERLNQLFVGREHRMVELKREVNALLAKLGEPPKYEAPEMVDKLKEDLERGTKLKGQR